MKRSRKYLVTAFLIFYLFSNRFISESVLQMWEIQSNTRDLANDTFSAGIVLSGGLVAFDETNNRLIYGQSADRILQAIDMYQAKKIDKILISGGAVSLLKNDFAESVLMKKFLINIGIDSDDILVDSISRNTYENSIESKKMLEQIMPDGKFLLFTSAIHMRRAQACFKKQKINFDIYSTNNTFEENKYSIEYILLPSSLAIYQWEALLHEVTGMIVYKVMGYA